LPKASPNKPLSNIAFSLGQHVFGYQYPLIELTLSAKSVMRLSALVAGSSMMG
jgi:hypothetical protein